MDIKKSQRLSQYLSVVIDMVQYSDVGTHLLECGILSVEKHGLLQCKLREEGNAGVMNELLTMVNLRRGGFDALLQVLRSTDYIWVAEKLDPGKVFTETSSSCTTAGGGNKMAKMQNLIANVRQTINRKSEPIISDSSKANEEQLTFMSYRGSCPVEIPIHPRHYMDIFQKEEYTKTTEQPYPKNEEPQVPQEPMTKNEIAIQLMNLELNSNDEKLNTTVLIENVPGSLVSNSTTTDYFTKLAKRLHVPSNLKVIQTGKICKKGRRGKVNNKVKLEFQSEDIRNNFIKTFKDFIVKLEPGDEMYNTVKQLNISVPNVKDTRSATKLAKSRPKKRDKDKPSGCLRSSITATSKNSTCLSDLEPSKKHWYQQRFSLKSWKKKKRLANDISVKL